MTRHEGWVLVTAAGTAFVTVYAIVHLIWFPSDDIVLRALEVIITIAGGVWLSVLVNKIDQHLDRTLERLRGGKK